HRTCRLWWTRRMAVARGTDAGEAIDFVVQIEENSVPNRRRRKLSTAMSAFAALAVASPFAVTAISHLTASVQPAPENPEFVQAALITDLPMELMAALQTGLAQFGIILPGIPSGILSPSTTTASPALAPATSAIPGLATPGTVTPGLLAP